MPKQNKNNDVSGAVTVKPKKSTPILSVMYGAV